jgi:hypothetical protein
VNYYSGTAHIGIAHIGIARTDRAHRRHTDTMPSIESRSTKPRNIIQLVIIQCVITANIEHQQNRALYLQTAKKADIIFSAHSDQTHHRGMGSFVYFFDLSATTINTRQGDFSCNHLMLIQQTSR